MDAIARLLQPRSVAIVGASATPGALGAAAIANLDRLKFQGEVHLVNPNRDRIGERPCLSSVDQLPLGVDAAVLTIPRDAVLDTLRALARREVAGAVIFSAGFAEGGQAGLDQQRDLARIANDHGMAVEGPNCLGFVNYVDGVALTFVETPAQPLAGRTGIGIVSQSGAMAAVLGVMLSSRQLGISYSISTGNEAVTGVEDYLEYLLTEPNTQAFGLIVEQFRQPRRFIELARRARDSGKLLVLLHPGRSSAARESATTHTGAIAGDYDVMRTLVQRAGVIVVDSLEELGDVLEVVTRCPTLPSGGTAVLTESGAFKALTLDLCEKIALPLPPLTDDTLPSLRAALPAFIPVSNPMDLTAQALVDPDLYRRTLEALLADSRFGSIVFGIIQTNPGTSDLKFPAIINAIRELRPKTPVIFAGLDEGAAVPPEYIERLRELRVPYFASPDRALRAVARISELAARDDAAIAVTAVTITGNLADGMMPEYRAKELLASAGIAFPQGQFVTTLEQAYTAAERIGYPVVIKAQAAALPHKSDAGGVLLNLKDRGALSDAWHRLHDNVARHSPGLVLDGVLVEQMTARGVELIVGGRNDAQWGPVLLIGFGGVQAELMKDVRLLPADLTLERIVEELHSLKQGALLRGYRGAPVADVQAVARIVARVGAIVRGNPDIHEIELNPVIAHPQTQGALALDALIVIRQA
jgi:acyl-CoA synthetase (NDP forming)